MIQSRQIEQRSRHLGDTELSDSVQIVTTTIAALGSVTAAYFSAKNHAQNALLKIEMDGKMTKFLELTEKSSHAEGVKDQKEAEITGEPVK